MWMTRLAGVAGFLVAVGLTVAVMGVGVVVGSEYMPEQFWVGLGCATIVPAVFAALVAVPIGQAITRGLKDLVRHKARETNDTKDL